MPVMPDPSDFPSILKKGGNESHDKSGEQKKASTTDFQSKGPQIPEEMPPKVSKDEIEARKKELNQK